MYVYKEDDIDDLYNEPDPRDDIVTKIILNDGVNTFSVTIGTSWSIESRHMVN